MIPINPTPARPAALVGAEPAGQADSARGVGSYLMERAMSYAIALIVGIAIGCVAMGSYFAWLDGGRP